FRDNPAFLRDGGVMTYLLPPNGRQEARILPSDRICMPRQQRQWQSAGSRRLYANPGAAVVLRYQENGHVTMLSNSPDKSSSGEVFVYGTSVSRPDDTLCDIHNVWNTNGTGGDGRGILLTRSGFDDGKCYGPNFGSPFFHQRQQRFKPDPQQGMNRWCHTPVVIPCDVRAGLYTLYWVWDWSSRMADGERKEEIYTTCIDIAVT
ncbi:MAG: hypothetical protein Q9214_004531, partial [Letrouitia sp. 1 TL-2023]